MPHDKFVLLPRYDPTDPAVIDDPYPVYASLRSAGRLCRLGPGGYGVTRHADILRLARDPRLGSHFPIEYHEISVGKGPASSFFHRIVLYQDPPEHTRLRRLIAAAFPPSLVRRLRVRIDAIIDELLTPALDRGYFDAVTDLGFPLPVTVICELLGVPPADRDVVRPQALALGRAFNAIVDDDHRRSAHDAVLWLREYLIDLLRTRTARDGLLSNLLTAKDDGERLTTEDAVDNAIFAFFAGFETTAHLLASGCVALTEYPDEFLRMRTDPALVPTAVDEFLRYDAPIQGVARMVREAIEMDDRTIRPGRMLVLMIGCANRDEQVFREPHRLDIGRHPNPHLSFGVGTHYCLGAMLARLEATAVFDYLARKFSRFESADPPVRRRDTTFRAYENVPIRVVAA
ncbi:cytochrome P450 [Nocardia sp. NPDC051321]|uniref:cytochrome P450 n=1 Tax=Nocardia sp. NPDC051321 TaxID=3364323 RepID=UPI003799B547